MCVMRNEAFVKLPLRQRKFAQTKLGLMKAAVAAMRRRPLEEISTPELCAAVSISNASFFNYFPKKTDLLVYFIQLWSLEMTWHGRRLVQECGGGGLAAIEEIFALTARQVVKDPRIMAEIIAHQARMSAPENPHEISLAERLLAYPELRGIETLPAEGLDSLLPPFLERAVAAGELPKDLDRETAMQAIISVFFGVPIVCRPRDVHAVEPMYRRQLRLIWAGLRFRPARSKS
jgi:AcrR family transcriptional regulator